MSTQISASKTRSILALGAMVTALTLGETAKAAGGIHVGGGGDTDAIEFVKLMKEMPKLVRSMPELRSLATAEALAKLAEKFEASLNDSDITNDQVVFKAGPLTYNGVEKAAYFDGTHAVVDRAIWTSYAKPGLKSRKRALVLLESLLALGIELDRYKASEGVFAIGVDDVGVYAKIVKASEAETALKQSCDLVITALDGSEPLMAYTIDFDFYWKIGERVFSLHYLAGAESFARDLPVIGIWSSRRESFASPKDNLLHHEIQKILVTGGIAKLTHAKSSIFTREHEDGSFEHWEWKNGQIGEFLGKRKSQKIPNYEGNSVLVNTESNDSESKIVSTCVETPVSNDWKAILAQPELKSALTKFDDFSKRVTAAEIAYEICVAEKSETDCASQRTLLDGLVGSVDSRWTSLTQGLKEIYRKRYAAPKRPISADAIAQDSKQRALEALERARADQRARETVDEIKKLREELERRHRGHGHRGHGRR